MSLIQLKGINHLLNSLVIKKKRKKKAKYFFDWSLIFKKLFDCKDRFSGGMITNVLNTFYQVSGSEHWTGFHIGFLLAAGGKLLLLEMQQRNTYSLLSKCM